MKGERKDFKHLKQFIVLTYNCYQLINFQTMVNSDNLHLNDAESIAFWKKETLSLIVSLFIILSINITKILLKSYSTFNLCYVNFYIS